VFAAFLRVEWKPIGDRYGDKSTTKVVPISACDGAGGLDHYDIPDSIAHELVAIAQSSVTFSATAFLIGEWTVKTSIVSNSLPE
jgi:hypothetical protein